MYITYYEDHQYLSKVSIPVIISQHLQRTRATKDSNELAGAAAIITNGYDVAQRALSVRYVVEDID